MLDGINKRIYLAIFIVIVIIVLTLFFITKMIKKFNKEILDIQMENEEHFRKVTEQLYDNIYELDITKNRCEGESTQRYFKSLGVAEDIPYDQALRIIAQKQIKEEFQVRYISTFAPAHVQAQFDLGVDHLCYDFMIKKDEIDYIWMRIDAHLFWNETDQSLHTLIYRKNID